MNHKLQCQYLGNFSRVIVCNIVVLGCSDLELKPQGKLTVTVVRANDLKNMETIGISDPYVVLYVRVLFKKKTRVIHHNLNPEWNDPDSVFHFDVEDTETQTLVLQVCAS